MRPNIDISHTLGGRVKDWAEANDVDDLSEAYTRVLEAGLEALEADPEPDGGVAAEEAAEETDDATPGPDAIYDCPECDFESDDWDEWDEHRREEHDIEP